MSEPAPSGTVVLRPAVPVAARWTLAGAVGTAAAGWVVVDAHGAPLAWVLAALLAVVTLFFALQLVPGRFQVRLEPAVIVVREPWHRREIGWERVALARVVRVTGEPVLELHLRDDARDTAALGILLPLGCDLAALDRVLTQRLGRRGP